MASQPTILDLDREDILLLEALAKEQGRSIHEVAHDALRAYAAQRDHARREWQREFRSVVEQIHGRIPESISPEEMNTDIDAAIREVREERRARRG